MTKSLSKPLHPIRRVQLQPFSQAYCILFSTKKYAFYLKKKNLILCVFLKNISPSKKVVCFILNNFHFLMLEGSRRGLVGSVLAY